MTRDEATPDLDLTPCFVPRCDLLKLRDLAVIGCKAEHAADTTEEFARTSALTSAEKALDSAPISLATYRKRRVPPTPGDAA